MNKQEAEQIGKADMRGMINTHGIETAAAKVAAAWSPPFGGIEEARLRGMILAAYEAGRLHQHTIESPVS